MGTWWTSAAWSPTVVLPPEDANILHHEAELVAVIGHTASRVSTAGAPGRWGSGRGSQRDQGARRADEDWISRESGVDYRSHAESWPSRGAGLCRRRGAPAALYASEHGIAGRDRAHGSTIRGESADWPL